MQYQCWNLYNTKIVLIFRYSYTTKSDLQISDIYAKMPSKRRRCTCTTYQCDGALRDARTVKKHQTEDLRRSIKELPSHPDESDHLDSSDDDQKSDHDFSDSDQEFDDAYYQMEEIDKDALVEHFALCIIKNQYANAMTQRSTVDTMKLMKLDDFRKAIHPDFSPRLPNNFKQLMKFVDEFTADADEIPMCLNRCVIYYSDETKDLDR